MGVFFHCQNCDTQFKEGSDEFHDWPRHVTECRGGCWPCEQKDEEIERLKATRACNHDHKTIVSWHGISHVRWCRSCGAIKVRPPHSPLRSWDDIPWEFPS